MWLPLLAAVLAWEFYQRMGINGTKYADLPADAGARRAAIRAVIARASLKADMEAADKATGGKIRLAFFNQAQLETGDFHSEALARTNSLSNRHVGSGLGDWMHETYVTPGGEPLRVYGSMEQSIEDLANNLLSDPLYAPARAALLRGDVRGYNAAIAAGNGKVGYVGPSAAPKAANYVAALNNILARGEVA